MEALWARMCDGTREDGSGIEPNDPQWDTLTGAALAARKDPQAWLGQRQIYGDLADDKRFSQAFCNWLERIWRDGTAVTIEAYTNTVDKTSG